ncbi:GNAT family N-acetyltransferase [Urechidicola vernalis]|uniref:GNAT family N-acetyltransferase n=1 Tax=Urechidicola vernalis TaxID=3075600 RepID=A0ABU2Y0U6_9FLAO|nr:GNAT family N-acetyltransferase [Urechidicola sp. P050]MDT0551793.1 GNAT family N-acetyltransferase [Urechidicola sp. P050]
MIEIKEISAPEAYAIRKDVLRENIPLTEKMEGDFDEETLHLGLFENGELGCVATFMPHESFHFKGFQYRLRGMGTHRDHQHKGFGKAVLTSAEAILTKKGVDVLWCNARVIALNFYKKSGWSIVGEEFDVHLVGPHYVMFKKLKDA